MKKKKKKTWRLKHFFRNVVRNREGIETSKKIRFWAPEKRKRKRKNMKAKSPANGPLLTPLPVHRGPKIEFSHKKIVFYNKNFSTIFFRFCRLFGRLKKETKGKRKNMKAKSPANGPLLTPLPVHRGPKIEFSHKKIVFYNKNFSTIFFRFCRLFGRLKKETKGKRKNMKAKSPANGPLLTPPPCPPRPKNRIFTQENRFLQQELLDDFFPLLSSVRTTEKRNKRKKEKQKKEQIGKTNYFQKRKKEKKHLKKKKEKWKNE